MKLWHPPAGCPRVRDGGSGPRRCGEFCRQRLVDAEDSCALDVADRTKESHHVLDWEEVGRRLGMTGPAAKQAGKRAVVKLRVLLVLDEDDP